MPQTLQIFGSPLCQEGFGGALVLFAMACFVFRSSRLTRPSVLVALAGLGVLLFSFTAGFFGRISETMPLAVLEPRHPYYQLLHTALRIYVGLPLLIAGTILETTGLRRALVDSSSIRAPGIGDQEEVILRRRLGDARSELERVRAELANTITESSAMSGKLRETMGLLLSSEERFRTVFENAQDGFLLANLAEGRITLANEGLARLTGYEVRELQRLTLPELYGPELGGLDADGFRRLGRGNGSPHAELSRRDAAAIPVDVSFTVIDLAGQPLLLAVNRDVTIWEGLKGDLESKNRELAERERNLAEANEELRERAEEMRRMNLRLRELQEVKDNFLSSVSHELRTPLTSIRSFSEILLDYKDAEEDVRDEFLTIINKESERLTRLINDVLDLAKIEAGAMEICLSRVSVKRLAADVSRSLAPLARERKVEIVRKFPGDLPALSGDKDKLQQVLTNLVSNAVKFGGPGTTVLVEGERTAEGLICVSVRDEGPGIPEEELKLVFEKFRQAGDTLTDKPEGTGLGLAICREIIQLHGGRIWGESRLGEGSAFRFLLPPALAGAEEEEEVSEPEKPEGADLILPPRPTRLAQLPPLREISAAAAGRSLPPLSRRDP